MIAVWPFVFVLVAGALSNGIWRWIGVAMATRIDETSEIIKWVRAVSTALVAGLVARVVVFPYGALETLALPARMAALAGGVVVFFVFRQNMFAGIVAGIAILLGGDALMPSLGH